MLRHVVHPGSAEPGCSHVVAEHELFGMGLEVELTLDVAHVVGVHLEAEEGEGPMLPVDALYQVAGALVLEGRELPVQGLIRHRQR